MMGRVKARKHENLLRFMADFETTAEIQSELEGETRVWASALVNIDTINHEKPDYYVWNNIDELLEYLSKFNASDCFFHNLKFDGQFIISYLLEHHFSYDEDLDSENTFNCLISDGQFYMINVRWKDLRKPFKKERMKNGKKYIETRYRFNQCKTTFKDSLKKIPLPVRNIAKAYGLEMSKGEIDYNLIRPKGWKITDEEQDYILRDIFIVAKALYVDIIEGGRDKMTASSDALDDFKGRLPLAKRQIEYNPGKEKTIKETVFRKYFPCLDSFLLDNGETYDNFIRHSYKGGWTYYAESKPSIIGDGLVYDVNSLYPSVMYQCLLPYGLPIYFKGAYDELDESTKLDYPLYIIHCRFGFKIKESHKRTPCIQIKGSTKFGETEYLKTSETEYGFEIIEFWLTSVDWVLINDFYDIYHLEIIDGIAFKGIKGIFKDYIDYWGQIKKESGKTGNKAMRTLAKRMLNSLYGKFGTNPKSEIKIPYLNDEGIIKYMTEIREDRESLYTAMASFITANARNKTIRSAHDCGERFMYADTDSIHIKGLEVPKDSEWFKIDSQELGYWKCEGVFGKAKYVRQKTYMESFYYKDGKIIETPDNLDSSCYLGEPDVKCAGMPDDCKKLVNYDNFDLGATFEGKLMPKRIKGGVYLKETTYQIKK